MMKRISEKTKILGVVPLLLVAIWFIRMKINDTKSRTRFFNEGFSSVIIESNSYYGRSVEFYLDNGLKIYVLPPVNEKVKIGDLVKKEPNTFIYSVYRKDKYGVFVKFAVYNRETFP